MSLFPTLETDRTNISSLFVIKRQVQAIVTPGYQLAVIAQMNWLSRGYIFQNQKQTLPKPLIQQALHCPRPARQFLNFKESSLAQDGGGENLVIDLAGSQSRT